MGEDDQYHVVVWKKSDTSSDNSHTYEVLRKWGHGRFGRIDGLVITEAESRDGQRREVVCVCDEQGIQTFRPDGSFLHLFGMKSRNSRIATAFSSGHVYVADWLSENIEVFALDGTLLFQIDVPRVFDLAVLADELFALGRPFHDPGSYRLDLHVYSAHDGTPLRSHTVTRLNLNTHTPCTWTQIQASPEGNIWLISDGFVLRLKPDFTLLGTSKTSENVVGVVWHQGQPIARTARGALVPLRSFFLHMKQFIPQKKHQQRQHGHMKHFILTGAFF